MAYLKSNSWLLLPEEVLFLFAFCRNTLASSSNNSFWSDSLIDDELDETRFAASDPNIE